MTRKKEPEGFDDRAHNDAIGELVADALGAVFAFAFGANEEFQIGYWRRRQHGFSHMPWPGDSVDLTWDRAERDAIVQYLNAGRKLPAEMGSSPCRLCDKWDNGSCDMTDEKYIWPEGYVHYVKDHGVKPPDHFIRHVFKIRELG